jgi:transcriptional regulator with XRE-family HTH domain
MPNVSEHSTNKYRDFGERIGALKRSYASLAHQIDKFSNGALRPDPSLIWRWTKGHTRPSPRYVAALSGVLQVEEAQLVTEIEAGLKRSKSVSAPESPGHQSTSFDALAGEGSSLFPVGYLA